MNKLITLMAIIGSISAGCGFLGVNEESIYDHGQYASVYQVDVHSIGRGFVEFHCLAGVADPCHDYDGSEISRDGTDVAIRLFSRSEKGAICVAVVGTIETWLRVEVPGGETYTFHFWQLGSETLDMTLYVPKRP